MKYVTFSGTGKIKGIYDDAIHEEVPDGAIKITDDEWNEIVSYDCYVELETKKVVKKEHSPIDYVSFARSLRDTIRLRVDVYALPTATVGDMPVTQEQMNAATLLSHELATWPKTDGWPLVPLPALPEWMFIPEREIHWPDPLTN